MAEEEGARSAPDIVLRVLEVLAAVAALVGWVALIGGAREYARLKVAGIPGPLRVASGLPREQLIGEGLDALSMPLLVASAFAAAVYFWLAPGDQYALRRMAAAPPEAVYPGDGPSYLERERAAREERWLEVKRRRYALAAVLAAVATIAALVTALSSSGVLSAVALFILIGALALAIGIAAPGSSPAAAAAIAVFVLCLGFGGIIEAIRYASRADGRLDRVVVERKGGTPSVAGFFVSRSGGDVQVAVLAQKESGMVGTSALSLLTVPSRDVESVVIGPRCVLRTGK
jgi:hypothetical protein